MLNLNIGSGSNRKQDYVSVDLYAPEADMVMDCSKPLDFDAETVDNIYSSHFIEHLSRAEWMRVYPSWCRVLKPGGTIEIRCPDIQKVCQLMLTESNSERHHQILYGLQDSPGEYHKSGYTEQSLRNCFPTLTAELLEPSTDYELHMRFTKDV